MLSFMADQGFWKLTLPEPRHPFRIPIAVNFCFPTGRIISRR